MKPVSFKYFAPRTIDDALDLLATHGQEGKILAVDDVVLRAVAHLNIGNIEGLCLDIGVVAFDFEGKNPFEDLAS